jgi:hypothetical protein
LNTPNSDSDEFIGSTQILSSKSPFRANITTARRELITIEGRWDISAPRMFTCAESGAWIYLFTISDYIADDMIGYQLFRGESCDVDITFNNYLVPFLATDATSIGNGNITRQVALVLIPDAETINTSPIFTTNEDGSEVGLAWCMRLAAFTQDQNDLVNWRDIQVDMRVSLAVGVRALEQTERRLSVDCSNGYDVVFDEGVDQAENATTTNTTNTTTSNSTSGGFGIVIAPTSTIPIFGGNGNDGSDKYASTFYMVEAFMCTSENLPLDSNDQAAVRLAGSVVRVCVRPNAEAISQGLYMRSVDSFYFSKNDTAFLQFAIEGGQSDFLGFTVEMNCVKGSVICSFETIMRADLFGTTGVVVGHGVATLQFGSANSRRMLSAAIGDRELIQKGKTRYTGFGVTIPVLSRFESQLLQTSSGSNVVIWPTTLLGMALYIIWVGATLAVIRHKRKWVDLPLDENDGVMTVRQHSGVLKDGQETTLETFDSNDASQVDPEVGGRVADRSLDVEHHGPKAIREVANRSLDAKQHGIKVAVPQAVVYSLDFETHHVDSVVETQHHVHFADAIAETSLRSIS